MKVFILDRKEDESGISGTGAVAEGVEFSDGTCVLHWFNNDGSVGVYRNLENVERVHGHGGKTVIKEVADLEWEFSGPPDVKL